MDILTVIERLSDNLAPTIGVIATGWFGYRSAVGPKRTREQTDEIISELRSVKSQVIKVQDTAEDNNAKIDDVFEKLNQHDEAHLVTMYLRLERDIKRAKRRGYTTDDEFTIISRMHRNYKTLGGNGYIDRLFEDFQNLDIRDTSEVV